MGKHKGATRGKSHVHPQGIFEGHPRGYGFVKTAEGEYFIPASKSNGAFDGDMVEISQIGKKDPRRNRLKGRRKSKDASHKLEARVVRILEHAHRFLTGRYEIAGPFGVVIPDDPNIAHDIFTLRRDTPDIEDGSTVKVRILEYPTSRSSATGIVEEVLGSEDDPRLIEERIIARYAFETEFSQASIDMAEQAHADIGAALNDGYRDIRDRFVFTIDPVDAKDFDDAISIEDVGIDDPSFLAAIPHDADSHRKVGDRLWRLGIHIADVSHFVEWGSSIDLDARRRATSVYLADRVIPMLPEELSNDLSSLKPKVDRLSFTVDLYLDDHSNLISYDLYPSIIRSNIRLTYEEALSIIEEDDADLKKKLTEEGVTVREITSRLRRASDIAQARKAYRESQGGIEFTVKEAKVVLNDDGIVERIAIREKNLATELIEEAMVFANEVVATHLFERSWPCIYRDHEKPSPDALSELIGIFQEFPWFSKKLSDGLLRGDPHTIERIIEVSANRLESEMVTMLLLRAMMRAMYSETNLGHYGLGLKSYCHFTSPIRRYPDLVVHRMLKALLTKRPELFDQEVNSLRWLSEHSSEMERLAERAEMDSQKAHMIDHMRSFIGQSFDAVISGVTNYGLYVRLDNCVEGLVPIRALGNEYFYFDQVKHILRGSDTGKTFRLGRPVRVRLVDADVIKMHLDFDLDER